MVLSWLNSFWGHKLFCLCLVCSLNLGVCSSALAGFGEFTIKDEAKLGRKFNAYIRAQYPIIEDPLIKDYVQSVVDRIAAAMPAQPFALRSSVVLNSAMNAFAIAAGNVFVFTGLILNVEHEADLAAVLSHELAHVSQRHIAQNIERSKIVGLGTLLGVLAGVFVGGSGGGALMAGSLAGAQSSMLKYSREHEREADQVGLNYLLAAGYAPQGMLRAFNRIRQLHWLGGSNIPSYLTTHPGIDERLGYLQDRIARLPASERNRVDHDQRFHLVQTLIRARYSEPEKALAYFEHLPHPDCLQVLGKAIVYSRLNRIKPAEKLFKHAVDCGEDQEIFWREAGRFAFEFGSRQQALNYLARAVQMDATDVMARFFYARALAENGDNKKAIAEIRRVLHAVPDDWEVHYYLGRFYGQSRDLFHGHLHLAYAYFYKDNPKKGRFYLQQAKQLGQNARQKAEIKRLEKDIQERKELLAG